MPQFDRLFSFSNSSGTGFAPQEICLSRRRMQREFGPLGKSALADYGNVD
jgi:hypothetical protein